jgi:hypothetical protein
MNFVGGGNKKTERVSRNGTSRDRANIGYKIYNKDKQNTTQKTKTMNTTDPAPKPG